MIVILHIKMLILLSKKLRVGCALDPSILLSARPTAAAAAATLLLSSVSDKKMNEGGTRIPTGN